MLYLTESFPTFMDYFISTESFRPVNSISVSMDQIHHKYVNIRGVKLHIAETGTGLDRLSLLLSILFIFNLLAVVNFFSFYV